MIPELLAASVVDPRAYVDSDKLHEAFAQIRNDMPLDTVELPGFDPFWLVTKHADILHVERQNELFHNGDRSTTLTSIEADKMVRNMMGGSPHLVRSLVQMDNPDHMNYRRLTQSWFMPANLRKLEARIREIAAGFVDLMAEKGGECDFARDVAFLYPLHVVMEILGVPEADEPLMLKLTQELFGASDPDVNRGSTAHETPQDQLAALMGTIGEFIEYFNTLTRDRRENPRDDIASVIANGDIKGQPLGELEAMSYYIIVATAGHDTTSGTTAGALWALCDNPAEFAKLKADMSLLPTFVEESIRWETPVKHFMRTATADTTLRDKNIAKGDWLMLLYPSGNRDEEVFEDPFSFKVDRKIDKHTAFGYGAHVCLGQHLARMEMQILWETLLPRLESVELNGTPTRTAANFVSGPKTVPIRYKMK